MVFNSTFNDILIISWRLVLLVEETGGLGENHRPAASHWQTVSHSVVSSTPRRSWIELTTLVVIDNECIGSYQSIRSRPRTDCIVNNINKWYSLIIRLSSEYQINIGVPQGYGPLPFLIYINDILNDFASFARLFADDTSLVYSSTNTFDIETKLNSDLWKLNSLKTGWLILTQQKTKYFST